MTSRRRLKQILEEIRRLVREDRFLFTAHCINESLPDEGFTPADALAAIANGWLERVEWDEEHEMEKFVIYGYALDARGLGVVARISVVKNLVVITAYEIFFETDESTD